MEKVLDILAGFVILHIMSKKDGKFNIVKRFLAAPQSSFFLFGPRGTGKSTWIRERFPKALSLDLLDLALHRELAARPERLAERIAAQPHVKQVVLDEIQRVPELLDLVHQMVENKQRYLQFIVTGSSSRKLKRQGVNLLAGRLLLRHLHPFMASELGADFDLNQSLKLGMLPLVLGSPEPEETLKSYAAMYLREEVQAEGLVRSIGDFSRFLEVATFSHGSQINLTNMASDCQVTRRVAEGYIQILEDLMLAFTLPVFTKRAKRLLAGHPKFYYADAGIFRSLRPTGPEDAPTEIRGPALEGLVAQHLRAWIAYSNSDTQLSFWRTKAGLEVDFVLYGKDAFFAIEVKNARTVRGTDLRGLKAFKEDYPNTQLRMLYGGDAKLILDGIACIPISTFLRELIPGKSLPS